MNKKEIEIPARMKRVNFFNGQLLTPADFKAEQEYFIKRTRLHNLVFHSYGIVSGLEVSIAKDIPPTVIVSPGMAVDPYGNFITLPIAERAPLPEKENMVYIVIYWAERETDFVPMPTGGGEGETAALRIEEYALLKCEPRQTGAGQNGIALARLKKIRGKWKLDKKFRVRRCR